MKTALNSSLVRVGVMRDETKAFTTTSKGRMPGALLRVMDDLSSQISVNLTRPGVLCSTSAPNSSFPFRKWRNFCQRAFSVSALDEIYEADLSLPAVVALSSIKASPAAVSKEVLAPALDFSIS